MEFSDELTVFAFVKFNEQGFRVYPHIWTASWVQYVCNGNIKFLDIIKTNSRLLSIEQLLLCKYIMYVWNKRLKVLN